ncbi:MAG: nucleotide pyrophosphohydrolase [Bacillota bacterium]
MVQKMADENTSVKELRELVAAFVAEREWERFHTPKNLAMSIAIEAAELMELFQWRGGEELLDDAERRELQRELADVMIYCLAMANAAGIDLADAVREKVGLNALKYPADRYRGRYRIGE